MGIFEHLPYTNNHDLNLDWIIERIETVSATLDGYTATFEAMSEQFDSWDADMTDIRTTFTQMVNDFAGMRTELDEWLADAQTQMDDIEDDINESLTNQLNQFGTDWTNTKNQWLLAFTNRFSEWEDQFEATYQEFINTYLQTLGVVQPSGTSTTDVISQKSVTDVVVVEGTTSSYSDWSTSRALYGEEGETETASVRYRVSDYIALDVESHGETVRLNQAYLSVNANQYQQYGYLVMAFYRYDAENDEYIYISRITSNTEFEGYWTFTAPETATHFRFTDYDTTNTAFEHEHKMSCRYVLFPAVAKATLDAHTEQISNKADKDGTYPDLTAGNAQQLLSDSGTENNVVYNERSLPVATDRVRVDKITGVTVAWNQMVRNGNFENVGDWIGNLCTLAVSDNTLSATLTEASASVYLLRSLNTQLESGRKYLFKAQVYSDTATYVRPLYSDIASVSSVYVPASTWTDCNVIMTMSSNYSYLLIYLNAERNLAIGDTVQIRNVNLHDLSIMSNSAVVDAMTSTIFKSYFPEDYYAFTSTAKLISSKVSAKTYYDSGSNAISSYDLPDDVLRGVLTVSGSNIVADGDTDSSSGTKTTRYGIVDLGTCDWVYGTHNDSVRVSTTGIASLIKPYNNGNPNCICTKYIISTAPVSTNNVNNALSVWTTGAIFIRDDSMLGYTNAQVKAALSGTYLLYELATPTTSTSDTFRQLQISDPEGIEKYTAVGVDESGTTVLSDFISGSETVYLDDLKAKLEDMPDAEDVEAIVDMFGDVPDLPTTNNKKYQLIYHTQMGASSPYFEWLEITE